MKICDIAQFYSPFSGGVKRYISDKRRELARTPGAHHLLIIPSHRSAVTCDGAATIHEIESPRLLGSKSYRLLIARERILAAVMAEQPDLIEVGDPYRAAWMGLEGGQWLGIPVLANYHSDFPRAFGRTISRFVGEPVRDALAGPVNRYLVKLYNRMTATVAATQRLCDVLTGMGIARTVHVPLGTDVDVFRPRTSTARVRAELGIADGERMLLFVGRLAREKNIRNLIGSLDLLPANVPPRRLVLVGDGEMRDYVQRQARCRADLTWLPYTDSAERLADLYSAADLFVHPAVHETCGLVALEAQACGTPVMVVRDGGVEEVIGGEIVPRIARDSSDTELATTISACLRSPEPAGSREARRARVVRRYAARNTFARMFALYVHLIERRPVGEFGQGSQS